MKRIVASFCLLSVIAVAGCTTSSAVSASKDRLGEAARDIIGNSLIGAKGKTPADQNKIDRTVARGCGGGVYTPPECDRHGRESRQ